VGYWYPSIPRPPKPWNTNALKIGATKAIPFDTNLDGVRSGILFAFEAENMTERDLTLPQDISVMQETKSSHPLHDSFLKIDQDYFIPSHHTIWIVLANSGLCGSHSDPPGCFHKYFEDDQEIVLFDRQGRHEIHIPMPALTTAKIDGLARGNAAPMSLFRWSPRIAQYPSVGRFGDSPFIMGKGITVPGRSKWRTL